MWKNTGLAFLLLTLLQKVGQGMLNSHFGNGIVLVTVSRIYFWERYWTGLISPAFQDTYVHFYLRGDASFQALSDDTVLPHKVVN